MENRRFFASLLFVLTVLTYAALAAGQTSVPLLINYQGELRSPTTGEPLPDGPYTMLFRIYDLEFGGSPFWEQLHSTVYDNAVEVRDGVFTVLLGSGEGDPLEAAIFSSAERWLEIRVETETLEPRQRLTSSPYAIAAEDSRLLGGREASDFASAAHTHSGEEIASGIIEEARIASTIARDAEVDGAVIAHAAISSAHHAKTSSFSELTDVATDAQIPDSIARDDEIMPKVLDKDGSGSGLDADTLDGLDSADLFSSSDDHGRSGVAAELYEGTESLSAKYVNSKGPDKVEGTSNTAMLRVENDGAGTALRCYAKSSDGAQVFSDAEGGYGVYSMCSGSDGYGVVGYSEGAKGRGVWGSASALDGRGVVGVATSKDGNAYNYGGYFEASGGQGRAVYGNASADGESSMNYGGYFEAHGQNGTGVYAEGPWYGLKAKSSGPFMGRGVYAEATSKEGVGLYGKGPAAGVHCEGDIVVTGAYRGDIGPAGGAPFPRPGYDSGWVAIEKGEELTLDHGIGGDPDNYVVDLQFMNGSGSRHQMSYGGPGDHDAGVIWKDGAYWRSLSGASITVHRFDTDISVEKIRVRIWVYN